MAGKCGAVDCRRSFSRIFGTPQPGYSRFDRTITASGGNTNGFAEPSLWRFHTIWPFDNHEVVHVYTAVVGRPSDFFNEGIAVSFQTDPEHGDFTVRFGYPSSTPDIQVHDACREYLRNGSLPLPVSRCVTTSGFRGISDQRLGSNTAGSFVLYMTERFGLAPVLRFFQASSADDTLDVIRGRIQSVFGVSLDEIENSWLAMLRAG